MNFTIRNIEYNDIPDVVNIRIRGWQVAYKNIIDQDYLYDYVKPELKRFRIGNKLFNYVVNEFKNNNKHKMILWCLKENYPSRMFYEHMGCINKYEKSVLIGNKNYPEDGYELKL